jgi:hypothetical protein
LYATETVLERKEPAKEGTAAFPYNEVEVIGQSPIDHAGTGWEGSNSEGVILRPVAGFGGVIDEPLGKVQELYKVKFVPEKEIAEPKLRIIDAQTSEAGPTPEETFKEEAPGEPSVDGERVRTPRPSPLDEKPKEEDAT